MKNTFTFDLLGASPQKLRHNLERFAKHDFVFVQGRILNNALNDPQKQKKALTYIKGARQNKTPNNKKLLFALHMFRQADKLENERNAIMGGPHLTVGADYRDVLKRLHKKQSMLGASADIKDQIRKYAKQNKLWGKGDKQKDKFGWIKKQLLSANFPTDAIDEVIKERKKTIVKHKKERIAKFVSVAKVVGKIALDAAKVIPGVGEAVKAAEEQVKKIPGVKEALDLAGKVKGSIKEAQALGDKVKIEKLKDVVANPKVTEALNIDKVVSAKIDNVVTETKQTQAASLVDIAEKIVPDKMHAAMNLIKAAKELDPVALKQIQSLEQLAKNGVYEAQKAIQTMKTAIKIQDAAKEMAMDEFRMWQYW